MVTGGAGFIGSAVVRHILDYMAAHVINVDKLTYAADPSATSQASFNSRYRFEHVDICDGSELRRVYRTYKPHVVLNLAAETHVDRSIDGPSEFVRTNLVGSFTLLEETLRYWRGLGAVSRSEFRFLHVSTDEVFGTLSADGMFTEDTPYAPNSPYSATKAGSDHLVRAWHQTYHLPTIITNCSNNYGPYQFPEKLIPHMVLRALGEEKLPVYGDGAQVRDWLYVEDHVCALILAAQNGVPGATYNIGGHSERTNRAVVETICDLLDALSPREGGSYHDLIEYVAERAGHDRRYAIDSTKIETDLGWRPSESFESGLKKTINWYLKNKAWCDGVRQRGYRPVRIGLGNP